MTSEAGPENIGRLKSKLRRNGPAMSALIRQGLNGASIERLHLGMRDPYRSRVDGLEVRDAVCFPLLGEGMRPVGRYAYLNLEGVTRNPTRDATWGPGPSQVYRLGSFATDAVAVVCPDVFACWLAWQAARGGLPDVVFLSRSHAEGWPAEWRDPAYWARFARVVLLPASGASDFMLDVAHRMGRPFDRAELPAGSTEVRDALRNATAADLQTLIDSASSCEAVAAAPKARAAVGGEAVVGRFEVTPVEITGAFTGGHAFYPFSVERRAVESGPRGAGERIVQSYELLVLRSDGHLLTTERLPAPTGTSPEQRVIALSDGTRIRGEPPVNAGSTWSFESIQRFVAWRLEDGEQPFRPLAVLLSEVEDFIRSRVWLPREEQYLLCAAYVVLSHCFRVFDAIPVLLITGPAGTGKSELGDAIASLSFHAVVASQMRSAGMIRLLDETRGLVVLDDVEAGSQSATSGYGELIQAIKCGYKRVSARKPIADRAGRIRMVDFFSPKVITTTRPVDAILGSRAFLVRTACPPETVPARDRRWSADRILSLRDELHCWAMASPGELRQAYLDVEDGRFSRRSEIAAPLRAIVRLANAT